MAWTENPAEPLAAQLDKYKGQALAALQSASRRLDAEPNPGLHLPGVRDGLQAILGFQFGAKGDKVRAARNAAAALAKGKTPVYLGPDSAPISIPGLPDLRIYVLGPPRDKKLLQLEEKADEMYRLAARGGWPLERALSAGLAADAGGARRDGCRLFGAVRPQCRHRSCGRACRRRGQRYRPLRQGSLRRPCCIGHAGPGKEARQQAGRRKPHRPVLAAHRCGLAGDRRRSRHAARSRRQQHQPGARLRIHRQRPRRCCSRRMRRSATG